jgi:hypothetical protein
MPKTNLVVEVIWPNKILWVAPFFDMPTLRNFEDYLSQYSRNAGCDTYITITPLWVTNLNFDRWILGQQACIYQIYQS